MPKPKFLSTLDPRPRLFIALGFGALVASILPQQLRLAFRGLIGWDLGVVSFLILVFAMMSGATHERMRRRAEANNESRIALLFGGVAGACISLLAIVYMLQDTKGLKPQVLSAHIGAAVFTVLCSWFLIHTMFAIHYAHEYYIRAVKREDGAGGLQFPTEDAPDYWDFMYFSFVIGMTSQVSDVAVASRHLRRASLVHGILAFFFNTTILATGINLVAGLVSK
jgi:uncharacterized membrane protein